MKKNIEIVSYDPNWPLLYRKEAKQIQNALGDNCLIIEHFGSTSVPGLNAKPKIDILVVVKDFQVLDISSLQKIGFEFRGEVISTGRYFCKKTPRIHLHIFENGNPLIERNLIFRDWLRTHEEDRFAYAALKMELAEIYRDGMEYCKAKTDFIDQIITKAQKNIKS